MYQIGDKVFYFEDSLKGELPIKESIVYGSFVARKTGDIYYYLKEKQVPAFCVADNEVDCARLRERFEAYRDDYVQRIEEQTERFMNFKEGFMRPEMMDNNTTEE